jgi:aminopeptidase
MDPCLTRLADVLVNYSTCVKPGDLVVLRAHDDGEPLLRALHHATLAAGANPVIQVKYDWSYYDLIKHGSDAQLDFVSPEHAWPVEQADVRISILANRNTKIASNLDPEREQRAARTFKPLTARFMERSASGALRWCLTQLPTESAAQDAEMSLQEYEHFVYGAGLLNNPDPAVCWRELAAQQQGWAAWLKGHDRVCIRGKDVDLQFSIRDRTFECGSGQHNFPDGEIFTGPVEDSVNGWVRFTYPLNIGRDIEGIEFTFQDGKVDRAIASKNQDMLLNLLDTDGGSRYLGEFGIGTNPGITRFTRNMLFDEKMQGSFHLAIGASYPETGGKNESAIHLDMLCDLHDGEIVVDGESIYRNGSFVI